MLRTWWRSRKYKFYCLWFDPTYIYIVYIYIYTNFTPCK